MASRSRSASRDHSAVDEAAAKHQAELALTADGRARSVAMLRFAGSWFRVIAGGRAIRDALTDLDGNLCASGFSLARPG